LCSTNRLLRLLRDADGPPPPLDTVLLGRGLGGAEAVLRQRAGVDDTSGAGPLRPPGRSIVLLRWWSRKPRRGEAPLKQVAKDFGISVSSISNLLTNISQNYSDPLFE
jgi:hypothetical protein